MKLIIIQWGATAALLCGLFLLVSWLKEAIVKYNLPQYVDQLELCPLF